MKNLQTLKQLKEEFSEGKYTEEMRYECLKYEIAEQYKNLCKMQEEIEAVKKKMWGK